MSCVLHIVGESLDLEAVLKEMTVAPYRTWQKGQPMARKNPKSKIHTNIGAVFGVSTADMASFDQQIQDATAFLENTRRS